MGGYIPWQAYYETRPEWLTEGLSGTQVTIGVARCCVRLVHSAECGERCPLCGASEDEMDLSLEEITFDGAQPEQLFVHRCGGVVPVGSEVDIDQVAMWDRNLAPKIAAIRLIDGGSAEKAERLSGLLFSGPTGRWPDCNGPAALGPALGRVVSDRLEALEAHLRASGLLDWSAKIDEVGAGSL